MQKTAYGAALCLEGYIAPPEAGPFKLPAQTLRIMRLLTVFLFAAALSVTAKPAAQTITLSGKNLPLQKVFAAVKEQTGYVVFFSMGMLADTKHVTLHVKDLPLDQLLALVLTDQPLTARVEDKTIFLSRKPDPALVNKANLYGFPMMLRVLDSSGAFLQRATVVNKKTKFSGLTDAQGLISLEVNIGDVLEVSYVGFETQSYIVKEPNGFIVIRLKIAEKILEEVVTGYTRIRKESFTGNSIRVSQEELLKVTSRSVIDALQVFDPSFRLEVNNLRGSDPNTIPEFYIRGRSGIGVKSLDQVDVSQAALSNNPNLPIFIMDGYEVPVERVYDYDVNRIASITILKDAAATAIYGSRAANGIVVIQTVPPVPGKLRIDYNLVNTLSAPDLSDYNLMSASEKIRAEELAGFYVLNAHPLVNHRRTEELLGKQNQLTRGVNTDWISLPIRNAWNHKHSLAIDGGSEELRFSVQLKYDRENGLMKASMRDRKGAGLIVDYRLGKFQIRNDFNYDVVDVRESPYGNFSDYTIKNPYDEAFDQNGKPTNQTNEWHSQSGFVYLVNPIYEALTTENFQTSGYYTLTNNTSIHWRPWPKVLVRGELAVSRDNRRSDIFIDPISGGQLNITAPNQRGSLTIMRGENQSINSNLTVNYVSTVGNHNMNFSGGFNIRENSGIQIGERYTGFPSGFLRSTNYANTMERKPTYFDNISRLFGSFAAFNYTFKDIYLLDLSGRIDGSSSFGSDRRIAPFWSFGAGVNLHNYAFLTNNQFFSRVKITGSFGQLGKTNFPPYASKGTYLVQQAQYSTGVGVLLKGMENPRLTWEITNTADAILDIGMLNNRLNFVANWYDKTTKDLVNDVDLQLSSGFPSYKDNVGKIRNRGYELSLKADVYRRKNANIGLFVNFASNRNTLLELSNSLRRYNELVNKEYDGFTNIVAQIQSPDTKKRYATAHTKYIEGGSTTSIFGMKSLGINPADGKEIFLRPDGTITYVWAAEDQVIIGDDTPKGQGGFGFSAMYKGFSIYTTFLYQYGATSYNYTLLNKVENVDLYNDNADRRVLSDRWQQPGDLTTLKDIAERLYTTRPTSRFIQKNNLVKINSISIAYDFDQKKIARMNLSRFKMQLTSNNLATISTIRQERGIQFPFARTFDLTIKTVL